MSSTVTDENRKEAAVDPKTIDFSNRLRPVTRAGVESLIASYRELGVFKDPIHIRKLKGGKLRLIAGGHRLTAALELELETIDAVIWSGTGVTDDWCRLMEVDDNLAGAEMDALDTAVFLAERKRIYEKLHPEMASGVFKGNQHTGNLVADIESFTTSTAEKFGITERHVRRLTAAGEAIMGKDAERLRAAETRPRLTDLINLANVDPDRRGPAIDQFTSGKVGKLSDALRAPERPVRPKEDQFYSYLCDYWSRAPEKAKRRFVSRYFSALADRVEYEAKQREAKGEE